MRAQTRRPDALYVLLNDCADDSRQVLLENAPDGIPLVVEEFNTGEPGFERAPADGTLRYSTANIATLRNEMLRRVLARWPQATHAWSVDSDVEPQEHCLARLIAADKPVIAAVVRNGDAVWNFMCGRRKEDGEPERNGCEPLWLCVYAHDLAPEPFPVGLTGACILLSRNVLEAQPIPPRYGAHPRGEDFPFCAQARELGFDLYMHPRALTRHHMVKGEPPREAL